VGSSGARLERPRPFTTDKPSGPVAARRTFWGGVCDARRPPPAASPADLEARHLNWFVGLMKRQLTMHPENPSNPLEVRCAWQDGSRQEREAV
jgi:hypothetical protein